MRKLLQKIARLKVVVTIEPGLYYPGLGACRVEDVVRVCNGGCELLSHFPYDWEIA
jgi:Xaa-Pro aminopeptidase